MATMPTCRLRLARRRFQAPSLRGPTCTAFPEGIPRLLLEGLADHRHPHPGDQGVRFEPGRDVPAALPAELEERRP